MQTIAGLAVCVCLCVSVCVTAGGGGMGGQCRGYGDKLRCPVTSIRGGWSLVCRVPLEVICCCVSDGLEMGLEREFTPPITERREGLPQTQALHRTAHTMLKIPQPAQKHRAAPKKEKTAVSPVHTHRTHTHTVHQIVGNNSASRTFRNKMGGCPTQANCSRGSCNGG